MASWQAVRHDSFLRGRAMRKLVWPGIGLVVGLAFAAPALGEFWEWVPDWGSEAYGILHIPAFFLTGLGGRLGLARGDAVTGLFPYAIMIQWVLLGIVAGLIVHFARLRKAQK